jgi:two-component system nitrogen regulation response regulator NtrX
MRFERLGGESTIEVDVRIIAATNKDLRQEIAGGRFREDLFFRLNVVPIRMPSLGERLEDIAPLAVFFLARMTGDSTRRISAAAIEVLERHVWPGNVRELKNFMERMAVMSDEEEISVETVEHFLMSGAENKTTPILDRLDELAEMRISDAREAFERGYLLHNLRKHAYNIARTAESIGEYPSNLRAKIKKFGIEVGE